MALSDVFEDMKNRYLEIYPSTNGRFPGGFKHTLSDSSGSGRDDIGTWPRAVWIKPGPGSIRFFEKSLNKIGSYQDVQLYTATYFFRIELWLPDDGFNEEYKEGPLHKNKFREQGLVIEYICELKHVYPGNGCRVVSGGYLPTDSSTSGEVFVLEVEMDFSVFEKKLDYQTIEERKVTDGTVST